ncbi:hypothetical protein SAMN05216355_11537 [Actinomyces ruminicola]|uniref:Uncharacterized protein n=1 Tax=Actinomyces ruminicola TaxID=332524 RepID=A0A1H0ECX7_9ACTO|nr:hypothetical protein [Actinomyces ruminicola]SDN80222.1 hypothetical protein SAMN05216355_11537 [Actinomyces ruminicola]
MSWLVSQTLKTRLLVIAAAVLLAGVVIAGAFPASRSSLLGIFFGLVAGSAAVAAAYGLVRRRVRHRAGGAPVSMESPAMVGLWTSLLPIGMGLSVVAQRIESDAGGLVLGAAAIVVLLVSVAGNATIMSTRGEATGEGEA